MLARFLALLPALSAVVLATSASDVADLSAGVQKAVDSGLGNRSFSSSSSLACILSTEGYSCATWDANTSGTLSDSLSYFSDYAAGVAGTGLTIAHTTDPACEVKKAFGVCIADGSVGAGSLFARNMEKRCCIDHDCCSSKLFKSCIHNGCCNC